MSGRWRCDYLPTITSAPVETWHPTQEAAEAMRDTVTGKCSGRVVAWYWSGIYVETPGEEAVRVVRESLRVLVPWLREVA